MVSAWRNFKNIFFTIIFRPEMLKFHPYSILTGDTIVGFAIFCVLIVRVPCSEQTCFFMNLKIMSLKFGHINYKFVINIRILHDLNQGPLLLDGLLGSKMMSLLKSKNLKKILFWG